MSPILTPGRFSNVFISRIWMKKACNPWFSPDVNSVAKTTAWVAVSPSNIFENLLLIFEYFFYLFAIINYPGFQPNIWLPGNQECEKQTLEFLYQMLL